MTAPAPETAGRRRPPAPPGTDELPSPVVDPRIPADVLIARAEAQGAADARQHVVDSWSFGDPSSVPSAEFDPGYVLSLRHQCAAAVASALEQHVVTESRTIHLAARIDEENRQMAAARSRMDGLARHAAAVREPGPESDPDLPPEEDIADDDPVWEGETVGLGLRWRLLILLGIVVAETPVHFLVLDHFLAGRTAVGVIWGVCVAMAVFLVTGPHTAALLVRARQATGAERRLAAVAGLLMVCWTAVVVVLGRLAGAVLDLEHAKLAQLHLTSVSVVLMFVGGLAVAGTMAFMLGLSRRHPFQEAYAGHRRRRDELEAVRRATIDRLNPAHTGPEPPEDRPEAPAGTTALADAVRSAYAAAEEAYFAALTRTVGDPSFTEAVQHRRGLRQEVRP